MHIPGDMIRGAVFQAAFFACTVLYLTALPVFPGLLAAGEAPPDFDPCLNFTAQKAAGLLDVPEEDLAVIRGDSLMPNLCAFRSKSNFLKQLSFSAYQEASPETAQRELEKLKQGFTFLSEIEAVAGLGDEAFWAGNDRLKRMVARKGPLLIDVLNPKDFEQQKRLLQILLEVP